MDTDAHLAVFEHFRDYTFYGTYNVLASLNSSSPKSLVRLSCASAVKSDEFRKHNVQCTIYLPIDLYPMLMTDALRLNCHDCAKFLLSTWPSKLISMSEVIPLNGAFNCYFDAETVLHLFWLSLAVLRKGLTPYLRVIDLRGGLLSIALLSLLIQEIFSMSNDHGPLLYDYHIIVDCIIENTIYTYDDFMNFLAMTENKSRVIHLHFGNLSLHYGLNKDQIWDLLQRINPNELSGLAVQYFSDDFLIQILTRFSSLTALELCSTRNKMLPLHHLLRLRRLVLANHHSTCDSTIADCIPLSILTQLEYLQIRRCPKDFRYLSNLTVPLCLREVNLNCCSVVESYLHLWRDLFLKLAPTLKVLHMVACIDDPNHFPPMVSFILPLVNLLYLNMFSNFITFSAMLEHVPKLGAMPNLKKMSLCATYEQSELESYDEVAKKQWIKAIEEKTAMARLIPVEIEWDYV